MVREPPDKLGLLAFLAGYWRHKQGGRLLEEAWFPPSAGLAQGSVRLIEAGAVRTIELILEPLGPQSQIAELLARVAQIVQNVIPFELFAILLYSERQKALRIRYAIGHRDEVVKNLLIPLDEGLTGVAASAPRSRACRMSPLQPRATQISPLARSLMYCDECR